MQKNKKKKLGEETFAIALLLAGFKDDEDFINSLILKGIIEAFENLKTDSFLEEKIRDVLVRYLETENEEIRSYLEDKFLFLDTERRKHLSDEERVRTDISFSMSGFEFVLECKTLKFASKKYLEEGLQRFIDLRYAEHDNFAGIAPNPKGAFMYCSPLGLGA